MEQHLVKRRCPKCNELTVIDKNIQFGYCIYCGAEIDISNFYSSISSSNESQVETFKKQVLNNIPSKDILQKEWDNEVERYTSYYTDGLLAKINELILTSARKEDYNISNGKRYISGKFVVSEKHYLLSQKNELLDRVFPDGPKGYINVTKVETNIADISFYTDEGRYWCYGKFFSLTQTKKGTKFSTTPFWNLVFNMLTKKANEKNIQIDFKGIEISLNDESEQTTFLSAFTGNDKYKKKIDNSYTKIIQNGDIVNNFFPTTYKQQYNLILNYIYEF